MYARAQDRQISARLQSLAETADDAYDPPPDMELALRESDGRISTSDGGEPGVALLNGPPGFAEIRAEGRRYRVLVMDRPEGRLVAMTELGPYEAARNRLLMALGFAELAGILASIAVVVLFTKRSVRPLAQALALQRRFVADASHELRAPLTVLHTGLSCWPIGSARRIPKCCRRMPTRWSPTPARWVTSSTTYSPRPP